MKGIAPISTGSAQAAAASQTAKPGLFSRILQGISNRVGDMPSPQGSFRGTLHDDQRRLLVGRAVAPADAPAARKLITLDGIGRIVDIPARLPDRRLQDLLDKSITPLTWTPAAQEQKRITPGEAVVDLCRLLHDHRAEADTTRIQLFLRDTYLAGGAHRAGLDMAVGMLRDALPAHPSLLRKVEEIASQVVAVRHVTRENDNYYGRTFDSAFAAHLVHSDAPVFKEVVRALHGELSATFEREADVLTCLKVAGLLRDDTSH